MWQQMSVHCARVCLFSLPLLCPHQQIITFTHLQPAVQSPLCHGHEPCQRGKADLDVSSHPDNQITTSQLSYYQGFSVFLVHISRDVIILSAMASRQEWNRRSICLDFCFITLLTNTSSVQLMIVGHSLHRLVKQVQIPECNLSTLPHKNWAE